MKSKLMEIQKLRAFAVLMVLFGHMPLKLPQVIMHGYSGVNLFFVISGYVVTLSFLHQEQKHINHRGRLLRDFYLRRLFRIFPVAIGWIFIYFIIAQFINFGGGGYGDMNRWIKEIVWFFSGSYNYALAISKMPGLFGQYWSLAVEIQFYFVLPLLLIIFRKSKTRIVMSILVIALTSTLFRFITASDNIGMFTHTQMDALFIGIAICLMFHGDTKAKKWIDEKFKIELTPVIKNLISLSLVIALFILPSFMDETIHPIIKYPIYNLLAAILVILAQRDTGWILGKSKCLEKIFGNIAEWSYSIYISHVILYSGVFYFLFYKYIDIIPDWIYSTTTGVMLQALFLLLIALLIGAVSYYFIETPYTKYGKNLIISIQKKDKEKESNKSVSVSKSTAIEKL